MGHVLGGLPEIEASEFRGHLAVCQQCRARVAELRSLASDMAAAEREERATLRIRTQTAARRDEPEDVQVDHRIPRRRLAVVGVVAALLLTGLSMWNAHLRAQNRLLRDTVTIQEQTISTLGTGTAVPVTTSGAVTGVVSVDGDRVAYTLAGVPVPDPGERLVVWVEIDGQMLSVAAHTPVQIDDGRLASTVAARDATRFLVTIESVLIPDHPIGAAIIDAELDRRAEPVR